MRGGVDVLLRLTNVGGAWAEHLHVVLAPSSDPDPGAAVNDPLVEYPSIQPDKSEELRVLVPEAAAQLQDSLAVWVLWRDPEHERPNLPAQHRSDAIVDLTISRPHEARDST